MSVAPAGGGVATSVVSPARAGYLHPAYAASLREFGRPRELPASGAWILERSVPGSSRRDAMGCYPLFTCADWQALPRDLAALGQDLVSLVVVIDPLANRPPSELARLFPDLARPLKEHFVVELDGEPHRSVDAHHRRNARKALRTLSVERSETPGEWASQWIALYAELIARHEISGIPALSPAALREQLEVPGAVAFRAREADASVAMLVWYVVGRAAYYHLGASSPRGYALHASFALFWEALAYFAQLGLTTLELGGGAGAVARADDGLSRFKRGWSTGTRTAYLCGRIFDQRAYAELASRRGAAASASGYFPVYRSGEFA